MNLKYNVFGIGNAVVDYEIEITDEFLKQNAVEKGMMTLVEEQRQKELITAVSGKIKKKQSGGSVSNSMIAISQFGGKGFLTCKVANDEDGNLFKQEMNELGLETNLSELPEGITGKCLVMVTPDANRSMNTFLGIGASMTKDDVIEEAIAASEYVFLEGYQVPSENGLNAALRIQSLAKKHGVKVAYTFSDPAMVKFFGEQTKSIVSGGVDLLFANEEEARIFTNAESEEEAFERLKNFASEFVMTRSNKGSWIWTGSEKIVIKGVVVEAVDTTGAGDLFAGAYLYGITNGLTRKESGELANQASAKVVAQFGPRLANDSARALVEQVVK